MSDLISRQAAIDYCYQLINVEYQQGSDEMNYGQERVNQTETILHHLELMPSAQPEVVRCGQCKYAEVADKEDAQDGYTCQFHRGSIWFSGSYCSWAERRTDG